MTTIMHQRTIKPEPVATATAMRTVLIAVAGFFPDDPAGANRVAFEEAVYLLSRGYRVCMLVHDFNRRRVELTMHDGITVLAYHTPDLHMLDPRKLVWHHRSGAALLSKYLPSVDLVHGHSVIQSEIAYRHYAGKAQFGYTVHSPYSIEAQVGWDSGSLSCWLRRAIGARMLKQAEARCLRQASVVTALSQYTKGLINQVHGPELASKVEVIPGWVDTNRFVLLPDRQRAKRDLGWPMDRPVLFTLRRLVRRMGLEMLLRAVSALVQQGHRFQLYIGGEGPLRHHLECVVRELRLQHCVAFCGFVPDHQLGLMYGACDAFVLPSAELECFGLIAIEALATGRPVLATPIGAIPEIIGAVEPLWLARTADATGIAELLSAYLQGRLPEHDAAELRACVQRRYGKETVLPAWEHSNFDSVTALMR